MAQMWEYYKCLKPEAQERYSFKLQCAGLSLKEDSYLIEDYWKDMRQWPIVISSYTSLRDLQEFIQRRNCCPGNTELDSYNYYRNGYVRTINSHLFNKNWEKCVVLKALVS